MSTKVKFGMVTGKVFVPRHLERILDDLYPVAKKCVQRMLKNRKETSSKFYPEIPCVVSKSLVAKYQRNLKLKTISRLVLPICGDKGKIVKWDGEFIRVPALFKKEGIRVTPVKPIESKISSVEFKRSRGRWTMYFSYLTTVTKTELGYGAIGVDCNCLGNIATIADTETGKVKRLGPDVSSWKENFKRRKRRLQKRKAYGLLNKLKSRQRNRTYDFNHKVSRVIVNYATAHRKPIVLEDLKLAKRGAFSRNARRKRWSFFQLAQFVKYKASLRGIPVYCVSPYNTSKECSRCGRINVDLGASKKFSCSCGHTDHRDANAAFNIGKRYLKEPLKAKVFNGSKWIRNRNAISGTCVQNSIKSTDNARELSAGLSDDPQTGKR